MNNPKDKSSLVAWSLLILLSLIWGSSFILIKKGLLVFTGPEVGAMRIVAAWLALVPLGIRNIGKLKKRQLWYIVSVGLTGSLIPSLLFAIAQTSLDSSIAGMLNALTPLFVLIIGVLFFSQRLSTPVLIGVLVAMSGSVLLIIAGNEGSVGNINYYALLVVLATVCYGVNLNIIKFKLAGMGALAITSLSLFFVGPFAIAYLLIGTDFASHVMLNNALYPLLAVVTLGVVGTAIALIFFNKLVQLTNPIFASSVTYIIPIVAVVWGLIDQEKLYYMHYLGMTIILVGVYLANRKRQR